MEELRIIVIKNGEKVMDEVNPTSMILSVTTKDKPTDKKTNQQIAVVGDPRSVFMANQKLGEHVTSLVMKQMKKDLEEHPEDKTAQSLLKLIGLLDRLSGDKDDDEDPCTDCPVKDECDEFNKPAKGKCA